MNEFASTVARWTSWSLDDSKPRNMEMKTTSLCDGGGDNDNYSNSDDNDATFVAILFGRWRRSLTTVMLRWSSSTRHLWSSSLSSMSWLSICEWLPLWSRPSLSWSELDQTYLWLTVTAQSSSSGSSLVVDTQESSLPGNLKMTLMTLDRPTKNQLVAVGDIWQYLVKQGPKEVRLSLFWSAIA